MTEPQAPARVSLICPECERPSGFYVSGHVEIGGRDDDRWPLPTLVMLALCEHCQDLVVVGQEWISGLGLDDPFVLWPPQDRVLSPAIPQMLRDDHAEARTCLRSKAYKAAVVMVRRVLEGVCREHGVTRYKLNDALEDLKNAGVIDDRLLEWGHGLRVVGNDGAHYKAASVTKQDAEDALELSEAILDYIYVLRARFDAFQQRRAPKSSGTSAGAGATATSSGP